MIKPALSLRRNDLREVFRLIILFRLFQDKAKPAEASEKSTARDKVTLFGRIRCPQCQWRPNATSRWYCADCDHPEYFFDGCGTAWNTFSTRGRCPGCGHQWRWTVCLRCHSWSRHEEWYEK